MKERAVFFDRDGVIVRPVDGEAPLNPEDLTLIPEIIPVIIAIKKQSFLCVIVSNQPDVALGKISEDIKAELVNKFEKLLVDNGISVDAIYYCFHHPNGTVKEYSIECDCRKPKPGMLFQAAKDFGIDLTNSWIVGDRASDVKAGENAGVKTILLDPSDSQNRYLIENDAHPDYTVKKLSDIIPIVCKQ